MPNATALPGKKTLNFLENSMAAQKRRQIQVSYRLNTGRFEKDVPDMLNKQTNKQTKRMKYQVIGNQIKEEKI